MLKAIGATIIVLFLFISSALGAGEIALTEVMPNPEGGDTDREWIEAVNLGAPVSVTTGRTGWRLSDGTGHYLKVDSAGSPPANNFTWQTNEVIVFVQDITKFRSEHSSVSARLIESSFSLKNSGDTISLINDRKQAVVSATYGESVEGQSLVFIEGSWKVGQKNGAAGIYPDTPSSLNALASAPAPAPKSTAPIISPLNPPLVSLTPQSPVINSINNATIVAVPADNKSSATILINEFLPNAQGRDDGEFIELKVTGGTVDLSAYTLRVGDKTIALRGRGDAFVLLNKADYSFNIRNSGETMTLLKQGQEIHRISYQGKAPVGQSFARFSAEGGEGKWQWTKPTPGRDNILVETAKIESGGQSQTSYQSLGEANLQDLATTERQTNFPRPEQTSSLGTISFSNPFFIGFILSLAVAAGAIFFLR